MCFLGGFSCNLVIQAHSDGIKPTTNIYICIFKSLVLFDLLFISSLFLFLSLFCFLVFDLVLHTLPNGMSIGPDAQLLQSQIAVIQQQQQQQKLLHNALTRTVSHQPTTVDLPLLSSAADAMPSNENHRKLERTQSEPAPQVNTSR